MTETQDGRPLVALITGGAGFVGRALIAELLGADAARDRLELAELRVFDLTPLEPDDGRLAGIDRARIREIRGDVRSVADLGRALAGVDVVFHCAALVDWGQRTEEELEAVNVGGTENVLRACQQAGVLAMVHVSTLDVVYGGEPIRDGDESLPYPDRYVNAYCRTKAESEQAALRADGSELLGGGKLSICVVRPCCIWGEGDPYHIGELLKLARRAPLMRIGDGRARSQGVYVGNLAHAMILAGRSLLGDGRAAGQVYFATDFAPRNFFDLFAPVIRGVGHKVMPRRLGLPHKLMLAVATGVEAATLALRPFGYRPTISRFAVNFVCQDLTFATDKAARELGYAPIYDEQQAYERTIEHFKRAEGWGL